MTRALFLALVAATMALGLAVHFHGGALGAGLRDFTGDALWAAMIAWLIGALAPAAPLFTRSAAALAICFGVELSQLVHFPALDAMRSTTAGHLALGTGFDPRDFAAYALGVGVAAGIEAFRASFMRPAPRGNS
jgi:hypothetical protein